eukprot:3706505-Prymnesium_polylepis.1
MPIVEASCSASISREASPRVAQGVTGGIGRTSGRGKGRGVVEQQNMRLDLQVGLPPADPDSVVSDRVGDEEICRARCESICCGTAD